MTETRDALIAFLAARLDEDEATARAASSEHLCPEARGGQWQHVGIRQVRYDNGAGETIHAIDVTGGPCLWYEQIWVKGDPDSAVTIHVARNDPARVLREMQAKRDLIAAILATPHHYWRGISACRKVMDAEEECNCGRDAQVERLLQILADAIPRPGRTVPHA